MDGAVSHLSCLFCTQNCYRTHGEGKPVGPMIPAFCKIMTESSVTKDSSCPFLELPAAFVRQYKHELCKTVVLEGPSGQTWPVDVSRSECIMKLKNGWQAFLSDHNLREGDIVVFKLIAKGYFIVQVFDKDGSEKGLCGVQNSAAFVVQNETTSSKKRKKGVPLQNNFLMKTNRRLKFDEVASTCHLVAEGKQLSLDSETAHDNKSGLHSNHCVDVARLENSKKLKRCLLKESSRLDFVDPHGSDPDCDDLNLLQDSIMRYKRTNAANLQEIVTRSSINSYKRKIVSSRILIHAKRRGSKAYLIGKNFSCVRVVSDAMAAARSHNSSNPSVIVKMKYSQVTVGFRITLGKKFSRKWLPLDDAHAILVDSTGGRWSVKWLWLRGGFSAGWRKFSLDHGLREKDVCLFEMTSQTPYVFMVHMFRQSK